MWRGAPLFAFSLTLGLALACGDPNEQKFPFSYEPDEERPAPEETAPAEELPPEGGEDVVLDAGEPSLDAEIVDAALEEDDAGLDTAEDTSAVDAGEDIDDPFGEGDAGVEEDLGAPAEESVGGTADDEVFGTDDGQDEPLNATDGDAGQAPFGQMPPGMARRGPILFPPVPPGGGIATMPLYPGETFDVATLAGGYTAVVMKNVAARLDEDVNVFVVSLTGALVPMGTDLVDLDRPGDLRLVVDEAEVRISAEDLGRIFERYLFEEDDSFGADFGSGPESPLRDVEVSLERGRVVLKGELEDGGDDVELRGTLEPTVSGDIAFIPTSLRRDDKPVDSLEDIFEEGLGSLDIDNDEGNGLGSVGAGPALWIDADALYFDLEGIVRAPALDADVIDVRTTGEYVRLLLEGNAPEVKTLGPPGDPQNYVEMRGGAVRFGKVIMPRADMLFLDADESDPLDLSLHRFDEQVIAGETRLRPDLGLEATLPDFEDIDESAFEFPEDEDEEGLEEGDGGPDDGGEEGEDVNGESLDEEELFE